MLKTFEKPINVKLKLDGVSTAELEKIKQLGKALEGLSKVKVNGDVSKLINSINKLNTMNLDSSKLDTQIKSIVKSLNELNEVNVNQGITGLIANLSRLNGSIANTRTTMSGFNSHLDNHVGRIMALSTAYMSLGAIKGQLADAYEVEKTITQVGIAGEKTTAQTRELRKEYYSLSVETGKSAVEIANAAETIIKTGQSFEDAQLILREAVKLSIATAEKIGHNHLIDGNISLKVA